MAGAKSDYLEAAILNWIKGTTFPAAPTTLYIGLHTAAPSEDGATPAEVSGGSYARAAVTSSTGWSSVSQVSTDGQISNSGTIAFPSPSANWGTVTHFGIWSASTSGNLIYLGALGTSRNILNGDNAPQFAAGALVITEG